MVSTSVLVASVAVPKLRCLRTELRMSYGRKWCSG